jgi:hypothetical protein
MPPPTGQRHRDAPLTPAAPDPVGNPSRSPDSTLRAALGTIVAASAAPYGYTISIWSTGAVLMRSHGTPRVTDVFAFLAGALAGFGLMGLLAQGALLRMEPLEHPPDRVLAGAMHWLAAGGAVAAAALIAHHIHRWEAWPLGSLAATSIYILGASIQLALVTARRNRLARRRVR